MWRPRTWIGFVVAMLLVSCSDDPGSPQTPQGDAAPEGFLACTDAGVADTVSPSDAWLG